jgi:hypothetical protein
MLRPVFSTCSTSIDVYPISLSYQAIIFLFIMLEFYHTFLELETSPAYFAQGTNVLYALCKQAGG